MQENSHSTHLALETLVERAKEGNRDSLEEIVRRIQDRIYRLSLRMFYHPADAEDATQEALIKIITRLDSYRGRSPFINWASKVASNHFLNMRQKRVEKLHLSFDSFIQEADSFKSASKNASFDEGESRLMAKEVKLMCTNAMLLALRREIRLAFIIGYIFGVSSQEGAEILDITPDNFRQRLSRGRKEIHDFMVTRCSLVFSNNPCTCEGCIDYFIETKRLNPDKLLFVTHPCKIQTTEAKQHPMNELTEFNRITAIFRSHPEYTTPEAIIQIIRKLVASGRFDLLDTN